MIQIMKQEGGHSSQLFQISSEKNARTPYAQQFYKKLPCI